MLTAKQFIAGLIVVLILAIIYMGIPQVPPCGEFGYQVMRDSKGELYFVLDEKNAKALSDLINSLSEGRCRLGG